MKTIQALVPQLRFDEFESEWAAHSLKSLLTHVVDNRGKTPPTEKQGIPLIEANAVGDRKINYSVCSKYVTQSTFNDWFRKYLDSGDTVFTTVGSTAECSFYNGGEVAAIAQNLVGLRFGKQNSAFMFYAISTKSNQKKFKRIQMGAVQPSIKVSQMIHIKLDTPTLPEQEKIAAFLTSVDDRIDQLKRKKSLLQDYKKGVMQKLFSQELRFKDDNGKPYPDWEEKKLGSISSIKTGKKDVNEGNPNGKYPFFTCAKRHTHSDGYSFDCEAILIAGNGEVGHCQYYSGKFEAYQRTYVLSDFDIPSSYAFIYLNCFFREQVNREKQMGAMPYIKLGMLKDFLVKIPTSIDEQTKIANFLSSLDQKIEQIDTQITQTQSFKKGLLQQMFV